MQQERMRLKRFAHAVVMLLVAAGLTLAPLASPASAMPAAGSHVSVSAMSGDTQAMSDDMPCCPGESKNCVSCPFIALCMLSLSLPAPSGASSAMLRPLQRRPLTLGNDRLHDGLGATPPDHPPRSKA